MTKKMQPIKGMKDILPEEHRVFNEIISTARRIGQLYDYQEISTPMMELVSVFDRTLGDSSDVVSKEMYDFRDKRDRHVALRPEFTAGIMRAFISNNMNTSLPCKLFSSGPLFRYDQPQQGRQRQFHQLNFENIGGCDAYADAETIELAVRLLDEINILSKVNLEINSLGDAQSRGDYNIALQEYLSKYKEDLSSDSKIRLEKNPLRILDSKDAGDQKIVATAPVLEEFYSRESMQSFEKVQNSLSKLGIEYIVNKKLVRGLDYYCHTTFEFTTDMLGAQGTVLAGGRYDGLCKLLGGGDIPGVGFAAGIERISMISQLKIDKPRSVVIVPVSEEEIDDAMRLGFLLRSANICTTIDNNGKIPKRIQRAVARGAKYIIFIGQEERENEKYKIKNLDLEKEEVLSLVGIMKMLKEHF